MIIQCPQCSSRYYTSMKTPGDAIGPNENNKAVTDFFASLNEPISKSDRYETFEIKDEDLQLLLEEFPEWAQDRKT